MATTMRMRGTLELVATTVQNSTSDWTNHSRTQVLMLLPRSERTDYEEHPARINIARPAWSMYYRPRGESAEIEETGIEPRSVSFHFLDIAMEDLGRWVGPLVSEGWQRTEVVVCAAKSGSFEEEIWTCFHHPFIPNPTRLPIIDAPTKLDVNCYIHQPTGVIKPAIPMVSVPSETNPPGSPAGQETSGQETSIQEASVQQASIQETSVRDTAVEANAETTGQAAPETRADTDGAANNSVDASKTGGNAGEVSPTESPAVNVATLEQRTDAGEPDENTPKYSSESEDESQSESQEESESIGQDDEYEPPIESETQIKLRQMIQLLKADGLDVAAIMNNEKFLEISEIATIEGIDVWSMVIVD
jgi:hypothetical protein